MFFGHRKATKVLFAFRRDFVIYLCKLLFNFKILTLSPSALHPPMPTVTKHISTPNGRLDSEEDKVLDKYTWPLYCFDGLESNTDIV